MLASWESVSAKWLLFVDSVGLSHCSRACRAYNAVTDTDEFVINYAVGLLGEKVFSLWPKGFLNTAVVLFRFFTAPRGGWQSFAVERQLRATLKAAAALGTMDAQLDEEHIVFEPPRQRLRRFIRECQQCGALPSAELGLLAAFWSGFKSSHNHSSVKIGPPRVFGLAFEWDFEADKGLGGNLKPALASAFREGEIIAMEHPDWSAADILSECALRRHTVRSAGKVCKRACVPTDTLIQVARFHFYEKHSGSNRLRLFSVGEPGHPLSGCLILSRGFCVAYHEEEEDGYMDQDENYNLLPFLTLAEVFEQLHISSSRIWQFDRRTFTDVILQKTSARSSVVWRYRNDLDQYSDDEDAIQLRACISACENDMVCYVEKQGQLRGIVVGEIAFDQRSMSITASPKVANDTGSGVRSRGQLFPNYARDDDDLFQVCLLLPRDWSPEKYGECLGGIRALAEHASVKCNLSDTYRLGSVGKKASFGQDDEYIDEQNVFSSWLVNLWKAAPVEAKHWPITSTCRPECLYACRWAQAATFDSMVAIEDHSPYCRCMGCIRVRYAKFCEMKHSKRKVPPSSASSVRKRPAQRTK